MKTLRILILTCLAMAAACNSADKQSYVTWFREGALRIDYFHTGDSESEAVEIDRTFIYGLWAGSRINLIDTLNNGAYYYKIYDPTTGKLIYSKGFDSFFKEYQTTTPALNGEVKQFHESAIIPLPVSSVDFAIEKRNPTGEMHEICRFPVNPDDALDAPMDPSVKVYTMLDNGDPAGKADIAIIGEGYTEEEEQKFQEDLVRFTDNFFSIEPCKSYKDNFNVRGVLKASKDSGIDEPRAGIDVQTAVNASFNTLGSERYVLTEDNKSLRDIAGQVPYDALFIMVNHSRYGGGGIYNFYCVFTSDNIYSENVMIHEAGHSFFGLADEYYSSSTAYNDFYPPGYEPVERNITALLDPGNIKWKALLTPGIEVPTPWNKAGYDSLDMMWQTQRAAMNEKISSLKKQGAPQAEIDKANAAYNSAVLKHDSIMEKYLDESPYAGKTGAFEGAGYASKGLYRPSLNCIMFSRVDYFCPVCQDAMIRVINTYTE